jgi:hypothetical protein
MADLTLPFGGDLAVGPSGDIMTSDGPALTQQRVLRRLLTNAGDYIWQLDYGAGLAQFVGQPGAPSAIAGVARAQLLREAAVARTPAPVIGAQTGDDGTVILSVSYADGPSGTTSVLTISV